MKRKKQRGPIPVVPAAETGKKRPWPLKKKKERKLDAENKPLGVAS